MHNYRMWCLLAMIGGGLTLTTAQKKPLERPNSVQPLQANPRVQEQNKEVVRQLFEEMFSKGRYEMQGQVFAKNCTVHFGNRTVGLQEAVAEGKGLRSASPDSVMEINQISANGDMVTVSWTSRGTHTHPGAGMKPTGKRFNMRGRSEFKVVNGKIVEAFNEEYRPELFRQLGVSKTRASIFFAGEKLVATLDPIIPDRIYALIQ
jgi:predicted SnoaL-like aldol condensation-catalyzing enzyme